MKYHWIILLFCVFRTYEASQTCGLYGQPPCLPAPPGCTPKCATVGQTYCERIGEYPKSLIRNLMQKIDINGFLSDETHEEFETTTSYFYPTPQSHYGPPAQQPPPTNHYGAPSPVASHYGPPTVAPSHPVNNHINSHEGGGYNYPVPKQHYNYNNLNNNNNNNNYQQNYQQYNNYQNDNSYNNEPIYIPRPVTPSYNGNQQNYQNNYYNPNTQYQNYQPQQHHSRPAMQVTHYNQADWLKRYSRDISRMRKFTAVSAGVAPRMRRRKRSVSHEDVTSQRDTFENLVLNNIYKGKHRSKRQNLAPQQESLCQTRTEYIQPQAALNSKGNWMYVVNQVEEARQLVKTEICSSTVCSNLCQLPNNYSSRCEQKYIQKRLIALDANGQRFYTDTFWFPSCCVCTISNGVNQ